jgi:hypothetical protein
MKEKLSLARTAYRELALSFLAAAREMTPEKVEEIETGIAQSFWREEIERVLWPIRGVRDGSD